MPIDVLGPLSLYVAGVLLVGALLVRMFLVRLGRADAGSMVLIIGLWLTGALVLIGIVMLMVGPS